jgi:copper chaperone CopZ
MKHTYKITGMTCSGCVASVVNILSKIDEIEQVDISLEREEAEISMTSHIPITTLKSTLPDKYSISENASQTSEIGMGGGAEKSKLQQLKPLFLIFLYLLGASFLVHYKNWDTGEAMLDFMGFFYIVFSFFKFLDLKGFSESFRMYDPLAKVVPVYGSIYPFIELVLGLLFIMRFQITAALVITIIILGATTVGVTKTLLDKKNIRCACLGTALKLPMTEATFIENFIMVVMAISILIIEFI